ncbi:SRPBCC family protein [Ekhidna sp.]
MTARKNQNKRKPAKVSMRICFMTIVTSLLVSCAGYKRINSSTDENEGWTLVKVEKGDNPSWKAYSRKLAGTSFIEYKIEGNVASTPDSCFIWFKRDIHELAEGSKSKKYPTYEIVHESGDSLVTYVVHNEPYPLKDTEMSVRYVYFNHDSGAKDVKWREAWNERFIEPSKKLNRVETFRGSWTFSPTPSGSTVAVTTVQFDPKNMPRSLVEPMVIKFLRDGLEDIRKRNSQNILVTQTSRK